MTSKTHKSTSLAKTYCEAFIDPHHSRFDIPYWSNYILKNDNKMLLQIVGWPHIFDTFVAAAEVLEGK
jgi:hypothetical protein